MIVPSAPAADAAQAYTVGQRDFDDGKPNDPLFHFCSLAAVEQYIWGYQDAERSAAPMPDGTLQAIIDHGQAIADADDAAIDEQAARDE
jgi:hypothetical protein